MKYDMDNKVAIVTGAGSGIGKATALTFAREGVKVIVSDIHQDAVDETAHEIEKNGGSALPIKVDVSKSGDVENMVKKAVKEFRALHFACNNAGIGGQMAEIADYDIEEWDRVISVNLRGVFLCMKYEIPQMLKKGGSIVNMASILGSVGFANAAAYVTAKHGVLGLTRTAAIEYSSRGIRVNVVAPGFIETPMLADAGILGDKKMYATIAGLHPIGRMGKPDEIAETVVWLCSDAASFISGHNLLVDGAYTAQ